MEEVRDWMKNIKGDFEIELMFEGDEEMMIGERKGKKIEVGYGEGEMLIG